MASVGVVGQHRPDSEPFVFKLSGGDRKRTSSREKMMFRRSSGNGPVAAPPEPAEPRRVCPPGPAEGGMPVRGCGAADQTRSLDRGGREGSGDCDIHAAAERRTGPGVGVVVVTNGHSDGCGGVSADAQRHLDASPPGRRESRSGGHRSISSPAADSPGDLPLERLTQGRSGVVRLARQEPSRREAWSIFPHQGLDPRLRTESGEGHRFEAKPVKQDWCDACSRRITAQAVQCQNCSYTCHLECQRRVQLDCNQRNRRPEDTAAPQPSPRRSRSATDTRQKPNDAKEEEEGGTKDLSAEEVCTRIEEFNSQVNGNGMKQASDGSFSGIIKVHLRLSRPVTVSSATKATDSEDAPPPRQTDGLGRSPPDEPDATDGGGGQSEKRTSFYLPCDSAKQVHISSLTTTRELIQGLLKMYMVVDNPRKFALYRLTHRDGQDLFQKLPLCERPLLLRLITGPDPEQLSFVLKENETGEVEWHAFSIPELQNFLVILGKEESERVRAVEQKYSVYRQKLQQALQQQQQQQQQQHHNP